MMNGKLASLEDILAASTELETEDVEVPGWGIVRVRALTAFEADGVADQKDNKGKVVPRSRIRPYILIKACIKDDGTPLFNRTHIEFLGNQPAARTNPIIQALTRLNGGENPEEAAEENFDDDPSESSLTS